MYAVYNTESRKISGYLYRDDILLNRGLHDLRPDPHNDKNLYFTAYRGGSAIVATFNFKRNKIKIISDNDYFQQDSVEFFMLEENCENVYISQKEVSDDILIEYSHKYAVDDEDLKFGFHDAHQQKRMLDADIVSMVDHQYLITYSSSFSKAWIFLTEQKNGLNKLSGLKSYNEKCLSKSEVADIGLYSDK